MMYIDKVEKFRKYVWDNIDFLAAYSNYIDSEAEDKSKLPKGKIIDCINSANDWMKVAAEGLDNFEFNYEAGESFACLQAIQLISYIHIVFLSIRDINKIVYQTNKGEPFCENDEIFKDYPFDMSDNDYFRNIRSAFGEHGTDLHFKETKGQKGDTHFFTSWPVMRPYTTDKGVTYDFYTLIYNKDKSNEYKFFGFRINDLYLFLDRYINYLDDLIEKIESLKSEYNNIMSNIQIEDSKSVIGKIEILINENKKRLSNDYYDGILKELKIFYEQKYENDDIQLLMNKYRVRLDFILSELEFNIQNMIVYEITDGKLLEFNCHDNIIFKEFANLSNNIFAGYKLVFKKILYSYIMEKIDIEENELENLNDEQLYCLLIACSNRRNAE